MPFPQLTSFPSFTNRGLALWSFSSMEQHTNSMRSLHCTSTLHASHGGCTYQEDEFSLVLELLSWQWPSRQGAPDFGLHKLAFWPISLCVLSFVSCASFGAGVNLHDGQRYGLSPDHHCSPQPFHIARSASPGSAARPTDVSLCAFTQSHGPRTSLRTRFFTCFLVLAVSPLA